MFHFEHSRYEGLQHARFLEVRQGPSLNHPQERLNVLFKARMCPSAVVTTGSHHVYEERRDKKPQT